MERLFRRGLGLIRDTIEPEELRSRTHWGTGGGAEQGWEAYLLPALCPYEICCRNSHAPSLRKIRYVFYFRLAWTPSSFTMIEW